ncbi:prepilin-type N-terminal cleavage/methylation domain-containing protein [Tychonema sp. LEGE 07199]|uniref:pilus assembly FimT family protein n=1 Tax=unclassified Tychonema TaxID=2642144 RepID=UPI00187EA8A0|nr:MULTISPECIES: prepilin-type N-terminal cleavage/methylation domain-containing protein [unclassified Tychonema]MBE9123852.1 prepilin-type N-terminal cleavage/methylation domain-containing protein [Tychonema sp. LEGE 07199]MBE9131934.1 prepilin-type N-terminal cleavage/methylation domain-containing protein [Tychonema sp. LEGE 07196]
MKTPPILLKLLHNSTAKSRPNFHNTASKKNDAGFTLIEVLIIVLILGIFASIAAPSWLGFINRQRVRTVNDRVLQTLRSAQSEAKRNKSDRVVTFTLSDPPTATIKTDPAQNPPLQTVTFDGGGEIKAKQIKLSVASCPKGVCTDTTQPLTFNYNGVVDINNSNNPKLPLVVTVSAVGGGIKQCVIVETLIGGMRTAEGNNCPPPPS